MCFGSFFRTLPVNSVSDFHHDHYFHYYYLKHYEAVQSQAELPKACSLRVFVALEPIYASLQRPCYQRGSPCQDPAGNWTTRKPDHHKEMQTTMVWSCLPFIGSCQNHLARRSERGKKTRQREVEVGRQHQGMDRPGVHQVPEGS